MIILVLALVTYCEPRSEWIINPFLSCRHLTPHFGLYFIDIQNTFSYTLIMKKEVITMIEKIKIFYKKIKVKGKIKLNH